MNIRLMPAAGVGCEPGDVLPTRDELAEVGLGFHVQLRLSGGAFAWARINGILPGGRFAGVFIDHPERGIRVTFGRQHIFQVT